MGLPLFRNSLLLVKVLVLSVLTQLLYIGKALADTTGMPWEDGLNKVIKSVNGPVAKGAGIVSIVGAGAGMAFSEQGSGMKKVMTIALALGSVFTASNIVMDVFAFSGSTVF